MPYCREARPAWGGEGVGVLAVRCGAATTGELRSVAVQDWRRIPGRGSCLNSVRVRPGSANLAGGRPSKDSCSRVLFPFLERQSILSSDTHRVAQMF